ncbi:MAG TPA: sodium:proton antiporter [Chthoniobacteraceae bacterium]|jgi:Na+/H+ antiporter NhaD/arsenite permease-like protein|nr:sodium:proton antiporter [Chthoniobacteraceae bacterium]
MGVAQVVADPNPLMILPFVAMLAAIACAPVVMRRHWERHYHQVSVALGAIPLAYYLWVLKRPDRIGEMAQEYVSFIALIGSLFVVAGGIHFSLRGGGRPFANTLFLLAGGLAANLFGTTGAAMLFIRPWIRMNRERFSAFHTVFFIFVVANCGGCLTPIANPPLFLGFIKGVPFWWVLTHCWPAWLITNAVLLAVFYGLDRINDKHHPLPMEAGGPWCTITGWHNLLFFGVILAALFVPEGGFLREGMMLGAALASYLTTARETHEANTFSFGPIQEVSWLFAGIFATMLPALDFLDGHAAKLGIHTPTQFYWLAGSLSAILDNAPTYLAFGATAFGLDHLNFDSRADILFFRTHDPAHLLAISLGSVFFGAMTYLGNGPNLMVKSITESAGVPTPDFARYVYRYAIPVLLPLLLLIALIFFR